jgi:hypothetical protein
MKWTILNVASARLAESMVFLAEGMWHLIDEIGLGVAVVLTLIGMAMFWHAPRQRMSLEEHVKDGDLTEDEARRQLRFYAWCAPLATMAGVVLLIVALYDMTE